MRNRRVVSLVAVAMALVMSFAGCGAVSEKINPEATAITINEGEDTISLGYANFVARYTQAYYDQMYLGYFGEAMWQTDIQGTGSTFQADVKDSILDVIEEDYLCKVHAQEYGVTISDDEMAAIEEAAKTFMSSNTQDALDAVGATEEYVKTYLEYETYENKVVNAVKASANISVSKDEAWQRGLSYVYLNTVTAYDADGNIIEVTDEYIADLEAKAKDIAAADDFDAAVEAAGASVATATYTKGNTESIYFDPSIIEAAEKLAEGEVSDVLFVEGSGYYVIRIDSDYDQAATESTMESLKREKEVAFFEDTLSSWKEAITWAVDDSQWDLVKFNVLFKAVGSDEAAE